MEEEDFFVIVKFTMFGKLSYALCLVGDPCVFASEWRVGDGVGGHDEHAGSLSVKECVQECFGRNVSGPRHKMATLSSIGSAVVLFWGGGEKSDGNSVQIRLRYCELGLQVLYCSIME